MRKILRAKGMQNTKLYEINEKIFAVSFVFLRSVVCTWVVYNIWVSTFPFITKVAVSITYGVGFFWIYVIIATAIKQSSKNPSKFVVAVIGIIGFIKKRQVYFGIGVMVWSLIVPFFLTSVLGTGFVHLSVKNFIIF